MRAVRAMSKASARTAAAAAEARTLGAGRRRVGRRPPRAPPGRPAGTSRPSTPSVTTSALPPTAVTTGGTPRAIASSRLIGRPSCRELSVNTSAPATHRGRVVVVAEHHEPIAEPVAGERTPAARPRAGPGRSRRTAGAARRRSPRPRPRRGSGSPCWPAGWPRSTTTTSSSAHPWAARAAARSPRRACERRQRDAVHEHLGLAPATAATSDAHDLLRHRPAHPVERQGRARWPAAVSGLCELPHVVLGRHHHRAGRASCAGPGRATAATAGEWRCTTSTRARQRAAAGPGQRGSAIPRGPASRWVGTPERLELGHEVLLPVEEVGHLVADGGRVGDRRHRHQEPLGPARAQALDDVQHAHRAERVHAAAPYLPARRARITPAVPRKIAHLTTVDLSLRYLLLAQIDASLAAGDEVIGISARGPDVPFLEARGLRFVGARGLDPVDEPAAATSAPPASLWRTLRRERPDVLHTHNPKPGIYGRVLGRLAGVPARGPHHPRPLRRARRPAPQAAGRLRPGGHGQPLQPRRAGAEPRGPRPDAAVAHRASPQAPPARQRRRPRPVPPGRRDGRAAGREPSWASSRTTSWSGSSRRLVAEKGDPRADRGGRPARAAVPAPARSARTTPRRPTRCPRRCSTAAAAAGAVLTGHREDVDRLYAAMDVFCLPVAPRGLPARGHGGGRQRAARGRHRHPRLPAGRRSRA